MHEIKAKAQELCDLKKSILEFTKSAIQNDCANIEQAGQLVDMVKDLCEAEKDIYKAAYYCEVTEAMKEYGEDMDGEGRMGYDHWRTSSGRYAPKGTGHYTQIHGRRSGYTPVPYYDDPRMKLAEGWWDGTDGIHDGGRMGYSDPDMAQIMADERHGKAYKDWKLSKRHYTETRSDGDKHEMSEHAKEHMADTVMTIKEIWADADPALREKMKKDMSTLMAEMK